MGDSYKFSQYLHVIDGYLYCEGLKVKDLQEAMMKLSPDQPSPFYMYSKSKILDAIETYKRALEHREINYLLGFSIKANYNPIILKIFRDNGLTAIAVSGNEIQLASRVGFDPEKIVLNGNGKLKWEVELAVRIGCLLNVDSKFDLEHIQREATKQKTVANVLFRINPDIDSDIHEYLATGLAGSKFGLDNEDLTPEMWGLVENNAHLNLVGLHCHLGSTIKNVDVFGKTLQFMTKIALEAKRRGFNLKYLNVGGGLGINYEKHAWRSQEHGQDMISNPFPNAHDLIQKVNDVSIDSSLCLILEPGRSLIGEAVTLVMNVVGCKSNRDTNYIVVDGSMNELIRPSFYGSYHHIELTEPSVSDKLTRYKFDIVGPVCECADFLGKGRWLNRPHEGCGIAVFDSGAYCGSMSSNYNLRMRPAEVLVEKKDFKIIRYPDSLDHLLQLYPISLSEPETSCNGQLEDHGTSD